MCRQRNVNLWSLALLQLHRIKRVLFACRPPFTDRHFFRWLPTYGLIVQWRPLEQPLIWKI